ncbi:MAG: 4Fe-4S binding protein [Deltaproteobacteria bacterium]|nr:4Fe-4S binding protein [Deltaproteobacteria bacterium]
MRTLRRISQWAVFLLFAFLFLNTEYKGNDVLPYAVNVFLRLDPLVAGAATISGRAIISLVWPALVVAGLTILLGRFFCGWVCPMGSVLDAVDATLFSTLKRKDVVPPSWRRYKFLILFFLAASSLFTLQWVFLFDPIGILIRSLTVSLFPALNLILHKSFGALYQANLGPVTRVSESIYGFLKAHFLAFEQPVFRSSALVGLLFLGILAAEYYQKRFWCRNLCPLGALLALFGRFGLFRRRVAEAGCTRCGLCETTCRIGAMRDPTATDHGECVECMECQAICPEEVVRFSGKEGRQGIAVDLSRRDVLTSAALGAFTVPFFRLEAHRKAAYPGLIRPPGALPEDEFLARCTRCGECMRVCIANGLQPTWFEAGLEGLWSPILVSRVGYCEYKCTLCGQVCPTGAIRRLSLAEKKKVKIGLAEIDRSRCLPWKGQSDCIVCEEHCPTGSKAILLKEEKGVTLSGEVKVFKKPYIDESLCVGCGICETKCPLTDRAAVYVTSRGETRAAMGAAAQ